MGNTKKKEEEEKTQFIEVHSSGKVPEYTTLAFRLLLFHLRLTVLVT